MFHGHTSNLILVLPSSHSEFESYFLLGKNNSNFIPETKEKQISFWKIVWLKLNTVLNALHVFSSIPHIYKAGFIIIPIYTRKWGKKQLRNLPKVTSKKTALTLVFWSLRHSLLCFIITIISFYLLNPNNCPVSFVYYPYSIRETEEAEALRCWGHIA